MKYVKVNLLSSKSKTNKSTKDGFLRVDFSAESESRPWSLRNVIFHRRRAEDATRGRDAEQII